MAEPDYTELQDLFENNLLELSAAPDETERNGCFRAIGFIAARAVMAGIQYGSYPELYEIYHQVQRACSDPNPETASRMKGMLHLLMPLSNMVPKRISDHEYQLLTYIDEHPAVTVEEVAVLANAEVAPDSDSAEPEASVSIHYAPPVGRLYLVDPRNTPPTIALTGNGESALRAYLNR